MSDHSPIQVGVIGAGYFGAILADGCSRHRELNVAAVADFDSAAAAQLANRSGAVVATAEDLLSGHIHIDLAIIATPNHTHADLVSRGLAAGLNVFVEKPLTITTDHARTLLAATAQATGALMVGHILRTVPGVRRLRRMVAEGAIGTPLEGYGARSRLVAIREDAANWWKFDTARSGGEMLHELHELDLLLWILGEPDSVHSFAGAPAVHGAETVPTVRKTVFSFPGGAIGVHDLSSTNHQGSWVVRIAGSEGALECNFATATCRRFVDGQVVETWGVFDSEEMDESLRDASRFLKAHNTSASAVPVWLSRAIDYEMDEIVLGCRSGASVLTEAPARAVLAGLTAMAQTA